jgi:hypothetical protein
MRQNAGTLTSHCHVPSCLPTLSRQPSCLGMCIICARAREIRTLEGGNRGEVSRSTRLVDAFLATWELLSICWVKWAQNWKTPKIPHPWDIRCGYDNRRVQLFAFIRRLQNWALLESDKNRPSSTIFTCFQWYAKYKFYKSIHTTDTKNTYLSQSSFSSVNENVIQSPAPSTSRQEA